VTRGRPPGQGAHLGLRVRMQAAAALLCMGWLRLAGAQPASPEIGGSVVPLPDTSVARAQADYDAGRVLLRDHDDAAALLRFRRSYAIRPDPKALANIALCEKNLNHAARAATLFGQVLAGDTVSFGPQQRAQIEELRAASLAGAGRLRVTITPWPAIVQIDDRTIAPADLTSDVLVDAGPHRVRVWKDGYRELVRDVDVAGGDRADVEVDLEPAPRPTPPPLPAPEAGHPPPVWMWIAGGLLIGAFGFVAADSVFH
jgi:hypothetical protein